MDFEKLKLILPKDPIKWTIDDVCKWLEFISLAEYSGVFKNNSIDGSVIYLIGEQELNTEFKITQKIIVKKLINLDPTEKDNHLANIIKKANQNQQNLNYRIEEETEADLKTEHYQQNAHPSIMDQYDYQPPIRSQKSNQQQEQIQPFCIDYACDLMTVSDKMQLQSAEKGKKSKKNPILSDSCDSNENDENINSHNKQLMNEGSTLMTNDRQNYYQSNDAQLNINLVNNEQQSSDQNIQLIIKQYEIPQTQFFLIQKQGGTIGRHSSNTVLVLEESISRFHAKVNYENGIFSLNDLGSQQGTYIKVIKKTPLKKSMILDIGSYQYLVEQILPVQKQLTLSVIDEKNNQDKYLLDFNDAKTLSLGRKANNYISLANDNHLSSLHCQFEFSQGQFYIEDMDSTNGTWLRLSPEGKSSEKFPLQQGSIFKIGSVSIFICEIQKEQNFLFQQEKMVDQCIICCEKERDALYMPCKHNAACLACSKQLDRCPCCKQPIEELVKIYKM